MCTYFYQKDFEIAMFNCDKCGQCCRHINLSEIYKDLDRGDGICKYLHGNLCSIYENRPLKCRIDECYEKYFADSISKNEFYEMNRSVCEFLKKRR